MSTEARLQLRAEKALPELQTLHDWLIKTRVRTANGGTSAKALDHILKRWPAIIRYAETGHLPIDNNPVENVIRPIAIGKNYAQFNIMLSTYWKPAASKAFRTADFA